MVNEMRALTVRYRSEPALGDAVVSSFAAFFFFVPCLIGIIDTLTDPKHSLNNWIVMTLLVFVVGVLPLALLALYLWLWWLKGAIVINQTTLTYRNWRGKETKIQFQRVQKLTILYGKMAKKYATLYNKMVKKYGRDYALSRYALPRGGYNPDMKVYFLARMGKIEELLIRTYGLSHADFETVHDAIVERSGLIGPKVEKAEMKRWMRELYTWERQ